MPAWFYFARPNNATFHDLTLQDTAKPANIGSLLGLGLKFVPIPSRTTPWKKIKTMTANRLWRDLELKCYFAGEVSTFKPDGRMYVRSKWTPPPGRRTALTHCGGSSCRRPHIPHLP